MHEDQPFLHLHRFAVHACVIMLSGPFLLDGSDTGQHGHTAGVVAYLSQLLLCPIAGATPGPVVSGWGKAEAGGRVGW